VPAVIPAEANYLGWQESLPPLASLRWSLHKQAVKKAGKQRANDNTTAQTVVLPPKKPPILDSIDTVRPEGTEGPQARRRRPFAFRGGGIDLPGEPRRE
jgi:hypothetical protein